MTQEGVDRLLKQTETWHGLGETSWHKSGVRMLDDVGDGWYIWRWSDIVQGGQADALIKAQADLGVRRSNDKKLSRSSWIEVKKSRQRQSGWEQRGWFAYGLQMTLGGCGCIAEVSRCKARSLERKCSKGDHIGEMLQMRGEADAAGSDMTRDVDSKLGGRCARACTRFLNDLWL